MRTGRSLLFMPRLPEAYAVWMGHIKTPGEVQAQYAVDEVRGGGGCRRGGGGGLGGHGAD